jgi:VWFA-related protein
MTLRSAIALLLVVGFAAGANSLRAQTDAPQQQPLRATTRLVQIAALVQDKNGNPVTGLTKDDFEIFDRKKPQKIDLFSVETNEASPIAESPLPPGTFTNELEHGTTPSNLTIILLDFFNTASLDRAFTRSQVLKLLLTIQPQDRVALYALGMRLQVLHEFAGDASTLVAFLKAYKGESPLDLDLAQSSPTNRFNMQMVTLFNEAGMSENQAFARDHSQFTTEALRAIADHVASLPGRKNLVWVSGNFPFSLDSDNLQRTPEGKKIPFATGTEMTLRALNSANIAIYPVDARGLMNPVTTMDPNPSDDDPDAPPKPDDSVFGAMQTLARRTGGRAYYNTNGIMGSIRETMNDSRVAYELGFYPSDVAWDGSFHAIHVKVNRPDVRTIAREGYFALPEPNLAPGVRAELLSETARSPVEATEIRIRVEVTPPSSKDERKLKLSVSSPAKQFNFQQTNGEWSDVLQTAVIQLDDKNQVLQNAPMLFPVKVNAETYAKLMQQSLAFTREVSILPAAAELRVIVRDSANGNIGSVAIPLASYFPSQSKR